MTLESILKLSANDLLEVLRVICTWEGCETFELRVNFGKNYAGYSFGTLVAKANGEKIDHTALLQALVYGFFEKNPSLLEKL